MTRVYDRVVRIYDLYDAAMDWLGGRHRRDRVLSRARDEVLKVGVGTGRNLGRYPPGSGSALRGRGPGAVRVRLLWRAA